jgi:GTP cyclohydrolase I
MDITTLKPTQEHEPNVDNSISDIRRRLVEAGAPYKANDNISEYLKPGDLALIQDKVEAAVAHLLDSLVIDTSNDHNTVETARRVAKMLVQETMSGRYEAPPDLTSFDNVKQFDELYVIKGITLNSTCAHHLVPIVGKVHIGVMPDAKSKVLGLSKFHRIVQWIARRPQIQEELTVQIADYIEEVTNAAGVAVVIEAQHFCTMCRGVEDTQSSMVSSLMRGALKSYPPLKGEFLSFIQQK